jgi:hypothetical protein
MLDHVEEKLPLPLGSIDDLLDEGDSSARPYKVFIGHNLGSRTFLFSAPIFEFFKMSDVANQRGDDNNPVAQRKLDMKHAKKLAIYTLKGLVSAAVERRKMEKKPIPDKFTEILDQLGRQPYLSIQPIVVNIRSCEKNGQNIAGGRLYTKENETAGFKIFLSQKDILWVVDGQHRRKAMHMVFEFLDGIRTNQKYPGKKTSLYQYPGGSEISAEESLVWEEAYQTAKAFCTIAVEVHLGLNIDEERQLFHDLNNLGKKVESGLALDFDNSNPVNLYIKEELELEILDWEVVSKDIVNWQDDEGAITRKDLVSVNARIFLNKGNISGATPPAVENKKKIVSKFWSEVQNIPSIGQPKSKMKTVAAQPVMLKALAKLVYDLAWGRAKDDKNLELLLAGISSIDFSHQNPMWKYYSLSMEERKNSGLEELANYLPSDEDGHNRDIGGFDPKLGVMRFGAKHNDIFPILGDMIRWKLNLPSRHKG